MRLIIEISNRLCYLQINMIETRKCYKRFSYNFLLCILSRKNDSVIGMPENVASRRILAKLAASVFH